MFRCRVFAVLGRISFLHVTLVFSREILNSALDAARPFGHHAMRVHAKPFRSRDARCFTGGGVCLLPCKQTHVFGTLIFDSCG